MKRFRKTLWTTLCAYIVVSFKYFIRWPKCTFLFHYFETNNLNGIQNTHEKFLILPFKFNLLFFQWLLRMFLTFICLKPFENNMLKNFKRLSHTFIIGNFFYILKSTLVSKVLLGKIKVFFKSIIFQRKWANEQF